ncbi:beta-1,3-glucanase family protein [Micromonospora rifamycinica]|uniref:Carbohydrate binding module (Family 6) n=1 Tax=Micromonospora rifamycinica TaxID=291594 RepID=A0A1C5GX62_9ACTN|nr:beta-1,3-glucanase family protein [Micromonospora rifamycinica]SCG38375.1 Carbohydrate binding module (family 6) [Micromonospora rifamycinica]
MGLGGAAVVGAPLVAAPLISRARASGGLPLTVVNSTGRFADSAIRMYVVGTDPTTGAMGYVRESGQFTPADPAHNGPDGAADIGVPLSGSGTTRFVLPMMSGRIYFAIDGRLRFTVVTDGNGRPALQYPVGWVADDPSFGVLHDCCEFTYDATGMYCNTTTVDMFSIPLSIRLLGDVEQATGKLVDGGRDAIFAELARQPGFERLVVGGLRVLAPGKGIETGRFDPGYYDGYIAETWDRYSRTDLRVRGPEGSYRGRVVDGRLAFDGLRAFDRPSTLNVFHCDGALAAPNDRFSGPVAAILGAGFNRSVLDQPDQPTTNRDAYYQHPVTNHYSRVLHRHSADGRAYGFPFDDVADDASYIQDVAPSEMVITLTPFGPGPAEVEPPGATPTTVVASLPGVVARQREEGQETPAAGVDRHRGVGQEIAAAGFDRQQGVRTEPCSEGGTHLGFLAHGDWAGYRGVDFGRDPATQFQVRVASGAPSGVSGLIEVRLDAPGLPPVGSIAVASTGGWQNWVTVPGNLAPVTGVHDVYLTFASGQPQEFVNVRWLRFSR